MENFNLPTIVLIVAVIVCVILIIRYIRKNRKKVFSCGGDCAHCGMGCGSKEESRK